MKMIYPLFFCPVWIKFKQGFFSVVKMHKSNNQNDTLLVEMDEFE